MRVRVRVPATTANLGPAFDCLGLALNLWNETLFSLEGETIVWDVRGEGAVFLHRGERNLVWRAFQAGMQAAGLPIPSGMRISCENGIPLGSGLGSSAAAVLSGLLGAQAISGGALSDEALFRLALSLEGHPDNIAPALQGGLVIAVDDITLKIAVPRWYVVYALPEVRLTTSQARAALPAQVSLADAVFNIGHALLVVEAIRSGDLALLGKAMQDRLHQPYRVSLIPGMAEALEAAREMGGAAAFSGAGPGMVAFCQETQVRHIGQAVRKAFGKHGIACRLWCLPPVNRGAQVEIS
ncbi:MAG: homoserine kinase [Anaerolineae bacterium]|nr:MAG: homoserine kinase [Anaerolineae bacterium]